MNINIMTEELLEESLDLILDRADYYVDTYGYGQDDFSEEFVEQIAIEMGVDPSSQVIAAAISRIETRLELDEGDWYDESMDGDHESALASAGFGTDEDYGYFGDEGW